MKKRWIGLLAALSLAVGVIAGKPLPSAAAEPLQLEREDCSLTINPEGPAQEGKAPFGDDLRSAGIMVDVYKVADAVKIAGYDSYTYDFADVYEEGKISFTGNPMEAEAREWEKLAQEAADITLTKVVAGDLTGLELVRQDFDITDPAANKIDSLETGLYLLIAHGRDSDGNPAGPQDYVARVKPDGAAEGTGETIVTIANSARYQYTFQPQLISIPGRPDAGHADTTGGNTANRSDWQYDMTVNLKPERTQRTGSLRIIKTLTNYETTKGSPIFVFRIVARLDGEEVFEEYESIQFDASGQETVTVTGIPAGALVTVTEEYTGASYRLESAAVQDGILIVADSDLASAEFVNTSDDRREGGHGIRNHFSYEDGEWQWTATPGQAGETPREPEEGQEG